MYQIRKPTEAERNYLVKWRQEQLDRGAKNFGVYHYNEILQIIPADNWYAMLAYRDENGNIQREFQPLMGWASVRSEEIDINVVKYFTYTVGLLTNGEGSIDLVDGSRTLFGFERYCRKEEISSLQDAPCNNLEISEASEIP